MEKTRHKSTELAKVVKQVGITAKEQSCDDKTDVLSEVCKSKCNHRILSHGLTGLPPEKRKELKWGLKDQRFPGVTILDQRRRGRRDIEMRKGGFTAVWREIRPKYNQGGHP